jgi:hypothetical protein
MLTTLIFVIRPKLALRERSVGTALEGSSFLTEPVVWTCETGDRVAWSKEEIIQGTKLIFVNHARTTFLSSDEWQALASSLAEDDVFDAYWSMEVFFGIDERVELAVAPELLERLALKGNRFLIGLTRVRRANDPTEQSNGNS